MTNDATSQTSCLPFSKPKVRGIPKRFPKAFEIISNCAGQIENVSKILWAILHVSLEFASTIGAYDTTEYSGLYSERELLYPVQNGIT
jgi:hypothetical protein